MRDLIFLLRFRSFVSTIDNSLATYMGDYEMVFALAIFAVVNRQAHFLV